MNLISVVCVLALLMHLIFLPPFLWAIKRRELRGSDEEAFRAVEDETAHRPRRPLPEALVPFTRTRMALLFGFLITLFILILASLIYVTVAAPPVPAGAD